MRLYGWIPLLGLYALGQSQYSNDIPLVGITRTVIPNNAQAASEPVPESFVSFSSRSSLFAS